MNPDIQKAAKWLSEQGYQTERGEQEYKMYYDVDIPKMLVKYVEHCKGEVIEETKATDESDYSIVRSNLMEREGYTPYCGKNTCLYNMAKTKFNGSQFTCSCGWVSKFPTEFIEKYKKRWSK